MHPAENEGNEINPDDYSTDYQINKNIHKLRSEVLVAVMGEPAEINSHALSDYDQPEQDSYKDLSEANGNRLRVSYRQAHSVLKGVFTSAIEQTIQMLTYSERVTLAFTLVQYEDPAKWNEVITKTYSKLEHNLQRLTEH